MKRDPAWADFFVTGTVVRNLDSADAGEAMNITVWVEYEVDGTVYRHHEHACTRYVPTGRGLGGRGFKEQTVIPVRKGSKVVVCYDPERPSHAYLRDNELTPEERTYKRDVGRRSARVVLSIVLGFVVLACTTLAVALSVSGNALVTAIAAVLALAAAIILAIIVFGLRKRRSKEDGSETPFS